MKKEFHWWEDCRNIESKIPDGQPFCCGHYMTEYAVVRGDAIIHTDQHEFLLKSLFRDGYRVFLHFTSGQVREVTLADCEGYATHSIGQLTMCGRFGRMAGDAIWDELRVGKPSKGGPL